MGCFVVRCGGGRPTRQTLVQFRRVGDTPLEIAGIALWHAEPEITLPSIVL
jgi:hypothetical protein